MERATTLPDLTNTVVLLPDLQFAPRLRRHLLDAAGRRDTPPCSAPKSPPSTSGCSDHTPLEQIIPGRARRELMLVEVLRQHPTVFNGGDPWQISSCLISLFDELTLNRVSIPDDLDAFTERLTSGLRH